MAFPNDRPPIVPHLQVGDMKPAEQAAWREALRAHGGEAGFLRPTPGSEAGRDDAGLRPPEVPHPHGPHRRSRRKCSRTRNSSTSPATPPRSTPRPTACGAPPFDSQGLQKLDAGADLSSFILDTLPNMYRDFDRDVARLAPGRWTELRYEDLVADPAGKVAAVADALGLGAVDQGAIAAHLAGVRGHRRNRHAMDPALAARIRTAWAWYFDRFGYGNRTRGGRPARRPAWNDDPLRARPRDDRLRRTPCGGPATFHLRLIRVSGCRVRVRAFARSLSEGLCHRMSAFQHSFLLGFDEIERALGRAARRGGDGYPPYNVERFERTEERGEAGASDHAGRRRLPE